jgi:hypothetical protein
MAPGWFAWSAQMPLDIFVVLIRRFRRLKIHGHRFAIPLVALNCCSVLNVAAASELDAQTLAAAEQQWQRADVHNYGFTLEYGEFLLPCNSPTLEFKIVRDIPSDMRRCPKLRAEFATVPLLFSYLHRALESDHHSIDAEFDPRYGYPRHVYIDWSGATDDFVTFSVAKFHLVSKEGP